MHVTGLTDARLLWDLPRVNYLFRVFGMRCRWSVLGKFRGVLLRFVEVLRPLQFWRCFVPWPREVTKAFLELRCASTLVTRLTGRVHQSDRCHQCGWEEPSV
jgi:hypothetical protein